MKKSELIELLRGIKGDPVVVIHHKMIGKVMPEEIEVPVNSVKAAGGHNVRLSSEGAIRCYLEEYGDGWGVSFGRPNGEKGINFKRKEMAVECVERYNSGNVIQTPISFHVESCCGCCDFYFSRVLQEIVLVCNECGIARKALFNDSEVLSVYGATIAIGGKEG